MSEPLGYFITFACYGARPHGDDRGSVDRYTNQFRTDVLPPNRARSGFEATLRAQPPMLLGLDERACVTSAIRETCAVRGWLLHALNVRTNHVHLVVTAEPEPELVMGSLKSWATRYLREAKRVSRDRRVWSRHGSTRYLWKEADVEAACHYVVYWQGDELP